MSLLSKLKKTRIPKSALESAQVPAKELVVAWGSNQVVDPSFVIATNEALYLQGSRIPWISVIRATWTEPFLELNIENEAGREQRLRVPISDPGNLPAAVRAQVTANVVVSERLDLPDGSQCLVAARRHNRDEIVWSVVFDANVDSNDPEIRAQADLALSELRASLGI
jgi:hypothetical protein